MRTTGMSSLSTDPHDMRPGIALYVIPHNPFTSRAGTPMDLLRSIVPSQQVISEDVGRHHCGKCGTGTGTLCVNSKAPVYEHLTWRDPGVLYFY